MEMPRPRQRDDDNVPVGAVGGVSFSKLMLVAFLSGLALCLQVTVWTLEVLLEERIALQERKPQKGRGSKKASTKEAAAAAATPTTIRSAETTEAATLYRHRAAAADTGASSTTAAKAAWTTAVTAWLSTWDPNANPIIHPLTNDTLPAGYAQSQRFQRDLSDAGYYIPTTTTYSGVQSHEEQQDEAALLQQQHQQPQRILHALEFAAQQGHAEAQFHVANALAAGFWPLQGAANTAAELDNINHHLVVQESYTDATSKQQQQAWLYWRMAAQQGHVEAAMALAHRMETAAAAAEQQSSATKTTRKTLVSPACTAALPYWHAAAAGILDQLESDAQFRAKVAPATDKHELHLIHLHGGTASQLDHHNRPDESVDALQFYHLRAVNMYGTDAAAQAAFTLAQYYHHGLRGVTQNVTLAAEYYTMAAEQNHWEAAGQLGKLYLWGIGVPQDPYQAQRYFKMGVPAGLYDCQSRYQRLTKQSKKRDTSVSLCEANCLNGMAMMKLLGLPHVTPISLGDAEAFLELAKDQGNSDAAYNLAMFRLGWKHHWKTPDAVEAGNGQTTMKDQVFNKDAPLNHPSQAEYQSILSDLRIAASKGHIQANFRVGLLYAEGVTIPKANHGKIQAIPKDCERATKKFKWIVENASPDRARRMRHAYQQYVAGDTGNALRNYLTAAATGSETAQMNAAFLLERGECPGLANSVDCSKAAVRLYKAAAERSQGEASLRVGDFYYYGRLRPVRTAVGPFGWTRYLVFPEELLPILAPLAAYWMERLQVYLGMKEDHAESEGRKDDEVCQEVDGEPGTCAANTQTLAETTTDEHSVEGDLELAAHYYQLAAASKDNARANFNLGFLYEWGLGLKQDFPLAKRHYDLAKTANSRESDLPVVIALVTLSLHERLVKLFLSWEAWATPSDQSESGSPSPSPSHKENTPRPSKRDKMEVVMSHVFSWDSLLILMLTLLFFLLVRCGSTR